MILLNAATSIWGLVVYLRAIQNTSLILPKVTSSHQFQATDTVTQPPVGRCRLMNGPLNLAVNLPLIHWNFKQALWVHYTLSRDFKFCLLNCPIELFNIIFSSSRLIDSSAGCVKHPLNCQKLGISSAITTGKAWFQTNQQSITCFQRSIAPAGFLILYRRRFITIHGLMNSENAEMITVVNNFGKQRLRRCWPLVLPYWANNDSIAYQGQRCSHLQFKRHQCRS